LAPKFRTDDVFTIKRDYRLDSCKIVIGLIDKCSQGSCRRAAFRTSSSLWIRIAGSFHEKLTRGPRRRDGGRKAQDATATPVITIGYAIIPASTKFEAHSEATAPVKSKNTPA
jgi:hypothetical protein